MPIDLGKNLAHCHTCDLRDDPQEGVCRCTATSRDIRDHAAEGDCPFGFFERETLRRRNPAAKILRYRTLMAEAIKLLPPLPSERFAGKGVVICGGGLYFDSAYVTIRVLRHLGYRGPIELWHLPGEIFPWMVEALALLNVTLVDAGEMVKRYPAAIRMKGKYAGYQLKPYAIIHSSFQEVLYIDADAYPIRPDFLDLFESEQFKQHGSIYFPDSENQDLQSHQWAAVGLPYRKEPAFESGIIYVDKQRRWRELNLTLWLCQHGPDHFFNVLLGDKDTFHFGNRILGSDYAMPEKRWTWPDRTRPPESQDHQAAMIQHDFDGRPLFAHRTVSKFSLKESVDFGHFETTRQIAIKRDDRIPLEEFCWGCLHELRQIRSKHLVLHRLESNGDILTLLPAWKHLAKEHKISVVTHKKYAPVLRGTDWLTVLPWDGAATDVVSAKKQYEAAGQWRDADPLERRNSWSLHAWAQTGVPDELFNELPLELENRDAEVESRIVNEHLGSADHRPLVLLSTVGVSSPYPHGDKLRAHLSKYATRLRILDLSFVRAPRIIDLCGLYERACLGIFTDSAPLHLGWWNRLPTIALVRDPDGTGDNAAFGSSEPRPHWIERLRYAESATAAGLERIDAAIARTVHLPAVAA